ncbi:hypothetical protein FKZ61_011055 [Litorilinea aerophila]|uniref:SD-repeat containing protein B domain-containing protein n=1 Tax=Litorilinea aerophila TaxID=1204385 RepID=A0A540VFY0_9CHLR|nr:SdrD B-like domain-containing protein [Litorilinea aerophila]MCC9076647.1 hypothetical protein [Litorilinea aerophila]
MQSRNHYLQQLTQRTREARRRSARFRWLAWVGLALLLLAVGQPGHVQAAEAGGLVLSGVVWSDLNQNGRLDVGEPVAADTPVFLEAWPQQSEDWRPIMVEVTDQAGQFVFRNLEPGTYRIWSERNGEANAQVIILDEVTIASEFLLDVSTALYLPVVVR